MPAVALCITGLLDVMHVRLLPAHCLVYMCICLVHTGLDAGSLDMYDLFEAATSSGREVSIV